MPAQRNCNEANQNLICQIVVVAAIKVNMLELKTGVVSGPGSTVVAADESSSLFHLVMASIGNPEGREIRQAFNKAPTPLPAASKILLISDTVE